MSDQHTATSEIIATLRRLCEYEMTPENDLLCHDGGFRYGGDFETLEPVQLNAPELIAGALYPILLRLGYIEESPEGFRVTERGRAVAYEDER